MRRRLERRAHRTAKAAGVPREVRNRLEEEIGAHLLDAAAEYHSLGFSRREAERIALRDFGDFRKARDDIGRAWRGRATVLFPDEPGQRLNHFRIYDMKWIVLILGVLVLLRWQVVGAYHIPTKSMEPTLHGDPANGDRILVNLLYFDLNDAERWQMAVFRREGEEHNLIKRIAGLPGETVDIRNGDLYIDGRIARKPRVVQEDLLVPVYRDGRSVLPGEDLGGLDAFRQTGRWTEQDGRFLCTPDAENRAYLAWARAVPDAYPGGSIRFDGVTVGDLVLRFAVNAADAGETVGAILREGRDTFEVHLPVGEGDAVLLRNGTEVARATGAALPAAGLRTVRLANLDDRVSLEVDGKPVLSLDVEDASTGSTGDAPVAEFGVRGGPATFSRVELLRDIEYRHEGHLPAHVPAKSYFMLGDNSGNSSDSRDWGCVPGDRLIGRPLFVILPPSRARVLH